MRVILNACKFAVCVFADGFCKKVTLWEAAGCKLLTQKDVHRNHRIIYIMDSFLDHYF